MAWLNWNPIEVKVQGSTKALQGAPAVVSWEKGKLHVFVHGKSPDANIYYGSNATNSWQWTQLTVAPPITTPPTTLEGPIAAVSWGKDRIDLFAVGKDSKVYHCAGTWNGSIFKWDAKWDVVPDPDNGKTGSAPAAASWAKDRMDVFIRDMNTNKMSNQHFEKSWSTWSNAGGHMKSLDSAPAAAASGLKRIDCFALEFNDKKHLLHSWYDGTSHDWARPNETGAALDETQEIAGAPAAASSPLGTGRVDVFARSSKKRLIHREFSKDHWTSKWEELGNDEITGDPAAVSWWEGGALKRLDCFAMGTSGVLKHTWWV